MLVLHASKSTPEQMKNVCVVECILTHIRVSATYVTITLELPML